MNLLIWLDLPLMVLGLFAMTPGLWYLSGLHRFVCWPMLGYGARTGLSLVFYLGLSTFTAAGVDAGLAQWNQACRILDQDIIIRESMMAPDFSLPVLGESRTVRLREYRGQKPVVLIFGNFY